MENPKLPHDIIMDVLSRLPVKSLMRFKCVCKPWNSLISHPQFVRMHLNRAITSINHNRVLLSTFPLQSIACEAADDDDAAAVMFDYPLRDPDSDIEIVGSCNGLIFLLLDSDCIILWNPSTREAKELPKPSALPHGMSASFGLGYDSSIDDYKVVRVVSSSTFNGFDKTKIEVFMLKTTSWRTIQDIHCSASTLTGSGTFFNGALHWLVKCENGEDRLNVIISFDLATETLQEKLPLPDQDSRTFSVPDLCVLRGCLAILSCYSNSDFEIWVMKEYGVKGSWTKLVAICYDTIPLYEDWLCPLYFSKNDEILMDMDGRGLIIYNMKEGTFRNLKIDGEWDWFETVVYIESLVSLSPNSNNGTDEQRPAQPLENKKRKSMK